MRATGIRTIIDPTAPGLGRYISRIQRINESVDLNIVVASGLYAFLALPKFLGYRDVDPIAQLFVRELREGINDTGVKAAFLKCAGEAHGLIDDVPRILAAVAAASVETGAPVMVHTNAATRTVFAALETLTAAGVPPARIVVAHVGDSNDMEYLREIAACGVARAGPLRDRPFQPDRRADPHAARAPRRRLRRQRSPLTRRRLLHGLLHRKPGLRPDAARVQPATPFTCDLKGSTHHPGCLKVLRSSGEER